MRYLFRIFLLLMIVFTTRVQCSIALEFRTVDGSDNNIVHTDQGKANTSLVRIRDVIADPLPGFAYADLAPAYFDGIDSPRGISDLTTPAGVGTSVLPNPRDVSNVIAAQGTQSILNPKGASDWLWQWGQFIDHDISLEEPTPASDPFLIPVSDPNDSLFNPSFPFIPFRRNDAAPGTGAGTAVPREQVNALTAYIDGSNVYGSEQTRADFLRTGSAGLLKTTLATNGEVLLPYNRAVDPFPNANPPVVPGDTPPPPEELFLAGDVRANEQIGLTAVHTLFVREHNRLATEISSRSDLDSLLTTAGFDPNEAADVDEFVYQTTRKAVGAQIQVITYNEFLPMLLGKGALPNYDGYDPNTNASISNEFANAAYRVGHTLLSPQVQLVDAAGQSQGSVALRDAFFNPIFAPDNGVEVLLNGLGTQQAQNVDAKVIDEVRNFLFAEDNGGLDLAAVNIQRGRDHGLPSYNDARRGLGLEPRTEFSQITSDAEVAAAIASQYDSIEDVDLWLGAISEDAVDGGLVGELLQLIIGDQFTRSRDGDRFFYLNDSMLLDLFPDVGSTRLSDVILRNTAIGSMQDNAFFAVPEPGQTLLLCTAAVCVSGLRRQRTMPG